MSPFVVAVLLRHAGVQALSDGITNEPPTSTSVNDFTPLSEGADFTLTLPSGMGSFHVTVTPA